MTSLASVRLGSSRKDFLADAGYDPAYGARPLKRAITRYVQDPLSLRILEGAFDEGDAVRVSVAEGGEELRFEKGAEKGAEKAAG